jgi:general secretion pathway protein D
MHSSARHLGPGRFRGVPFVAGLVVVLALAVLASAQPPPRPSGPGGGPGGVTVQAPPTPSGSPTPPTAPGSPGAPPSGGASGQPSGEQKPGEGSSTPSTPEGPIAVFIPEKPDGDKLISMNFDQADIDHVLKFLAEQSGKTIVREPSVQAKITIVSTAKITVADAFKIVGALLSVKGYTLIEDDHIVRVIPSKNALKEPTAVRVGAGEVERADRYITQVLQVEHLDATKLRDDLKPLVPDDEGVLIANADTNTLVMIDTEANVARLLDIIKALDTERAEAKEIDVISLEHADATELADELSNLFEKESPLAGLPADVQRRMRDAMSGGGGPGGPGGAAAAGLGAQGLMDVRGQVKIVAEKRTNSLLIAAAADNMKAIKDLVAKVDVDKSPEVEARIVPLQYADPQTLADQINQLYEASDQFSSRSGSPFSRMFGGFSRSGRSSTTTQVSGLAENRVVPDLRTRSLIVTADAENMQQITDLVKQLDTSAEIQTVVKAIPLENAVASEVASTITSLIQGGQRFGGFFSFFLLGSNRNQGGQAPLDQLRNVSVVADSPTNTILLTGPPETFQTLEQLIKQLDRRVPQVYIEVLIADVTLDNSSRLGIEWSLIDKNLLGHSSASGNLGTSWDGLVAETAGLSYSLISNSIQAFMRTLEGRSDVEIVSSPNIIASDNTPATISIGESIPYQASTQVTSGGTIQQTVDFIDVSNKLAVTPHVNQRERISLEVQQTVDALISFDEKLLAPRIAKREANTTVEVRDGQTIIIGGIIAQQKSITIQGVPILRKIPILGKLFEDKKKDATRSELLVFLTPHIIMDDTQVEALTKGQSGRLTTNPLDNEQFRPLDLPKADMSNPAWQLGPQVPPKTEEPTQPAPPPAPAPAQP